jgi:hypothetical protein
MIDKRLKKRSYYSEIGFQNDNGGSSNNADTGPESCA